MSRRAAPAGLVLLALVAAACGARTPLGLSDDGSDGDGLDAGPPAERSCLPTCTIGHECCLGGCWGPPAETPSDCCACLPHEIDSRDCGGRCGG